MRLLIMGPPGAGKGTQASGIAARYKIPAISTGQMFREAVKEDTPLGRRVGEILANGEYVSDELTEQLVAARLAQPDAGNGWLLDGFPRTMHQVAALDRMLQAKGTALDGVLSLVVDEEELVSRLLSREDGRADDTEETIRHRMEVYHRETEELLDHYRGRGLLSEVDGIGEMDEVAERLADAIDRFAQPTR